MTGDGEKQDGSSRRWDDSPGVFEFRLLQLETARADHEARLRRLETSLTSMDLKLDSISGAVEEIKQSSLVASTAALATAAAAKETGRRNMWGMALAIATVIATALVTYFVHH